MPRLTLLGLVVAFALVVRPQGARPVDDVLPARKPFPDFGFLPPPEKYAGRVFELSQDYPASPPDPARRPDFLGLDFRSRWKDYLLAVRAYCFEGNVEVDFRVQDNAVRRWYHVPWQHYGPNGREGIHGLTKEAPVQPRQLASTQTYQGGQAYAVAFYNEFGGYTIGRVWQRHDRPDLARARFPVGTVVFKLLFTDVPTEQVSSLVDPVLWQGYVTDTYDSNNRVVRALALIQMDIMVRDERAPLGWLFGTYQYNGALKNRRAWDNLVPVGMQWGNDPAVTEDRSNPEPVKTIINKNLRETVINDGPELPPTHLGWNGRLNGPVDNPRSSCLSCHATAQIPVPPLTPFFQKDPPAAGTAAWMKWFQNLACEKPFTPDGKSTDNSLQLAQSVQNYEWFVKDQGGVYARYYATAPRPADEKAADASQFIIPRRTADDRPIYKIQRSFPDKK